MPFFKNKAQKIFVFATDANGDPKTGDAANIVAQISIDGGTTAVSDDANPSELDATDAPGIYYFNGLAAETNGDCIILFAKSSTTGVVLRPVILYTQLSRVTGSVVDDAANSATTFETDLTSSTNDFHKDSYLLFTGGTLAGQVRKVTGYTGSTKFVTCDAFTAEPTAADTFVLINQ